MKSSISALEDFLEGMVWQDFQDELNIWIDDLQLILEDPDGTTDEKVISLARGSLRACRNFLRMPHVMLENILDDVEDGKNKKDWR